MVFQNGTLGGLALAAGLWLTASAAMAAPQPGSQMELGPSALPPVGYVDFCKRQPWDCGVEPQLVLARVRQAETERAALYAAASPASLRALAASAPAAVRDEAPAPAPARASASGPAAVIVRAPVLTRVDFVEPPAAPTELVSAPVVETPAPEQAEATGPARMTPQLWSKLNDINDDVNRAIVQSTDLATYGKVDYWATPIENGIRYGDCEDYVLEKLRALLAAGLPREDLNVAVVTTPWGESHAVLLVNTTDGEFVLDNLSPWVKPWQKAGYRWREREVDGDPFHWVMVRDPSRPHAPPPLPGSDKLVVAAIP